VKEAAQKNPPAMTPIDVACVKVTVVLDVEVSKIVPAKVNNIRR
jgi:hypothetical protein